MRKKQNHVDFMTVQCPKCKTSHALTRDMKIPPAPWGLLNGDTFMLACTQCRELFLFQLVVSAKSYMAAPFTSAGVLSLGHFLRKIQQKGLPLYIVLSGDLGKSTIRHALSAQYDLNGIPHTFCETVDAAKKASEFPGIVFVEVHGDLPESLPFEPWQVISISNADPGLRLCRTVPPAKRTARSARPDSGRSAVKGEIAALQEGTETTRTRATSRKTGTKPKAGSRNGSPSR